LKEAKINGPDKKPTPNNFFKNVSLWLVIILIVIMVFNTFNNPSKFQNELTYSELLNKIDSGKVEKVILQGDKVTAITIDNQKYSCYIPPDLDFIPTLKKKNILISVKPAEKTSLWQSILISWFPMLLLIGVWIFFMRQMSMGGGKAFSFGKSKAKVLTKSENKVTFKDVAGIEEAKEEVQEIIEFLRNPKKFTKLGGKIPKGVLLVGPPGTGKTLLAKAIAGEADVPFFSISGSEFVEMFVGVGAARVRDLFNQGKSNAPCIIFIDEIDAVGRHRGAGLGGGHDEREQTLNQLLVEMDGFDSNEGVIIVAATNRPDVLDPALLRPGRFDRQVVVNNPDVKGREGILKVHIRNKPLSKDVDLSIIARGTPGFSGADLANLVNEAALIAASKNKASIDMSDFEEAKDKILLGKERRSLIISPNEKKITAYHESGHTLAAKFLPEADPIHKVTIIPRGRALGLTQQLPIDDRHTYTKEYLHAQICILMGGRIAEELVLGSITTGAGNDIERATEIARKMVCEWGMSRLGPLAYGQKDEQIFLGKELVRHKDYSEKTAIEIDNEIKAIVSDCYEKTKKILEDNIDKLHELANALLEKETLSGEEVEEILFGEDKKDKKEESDEHV
jgi:cell division protease FtsH